MCFCCSLHCIGKIKGIRGTKNKNSGTSMYVYNKHINDFSLCSLLYVIVSDHLLAVLGQLSSTESLYHRYKLVDSFCKVRLCTIQ